MDQVLKLISQSIGIWIAKEVGWGEPTDFKNVFIRVADKRVGLN